MTKSISGVNTSCDYIFKTASGRYHNSSPMSGSSPSGVALNTLYAAPYFNKTATTATSIGIHVTTASAAGTKARLGIYNDNGSIYPGTLILDAGTVATDATGVVEIVINQALGENTLYWLALLPEASPSIGSQANQSFWSVIGYSKTFFGSNGQAMYNYAYAYGVLPTTYGAATSAVNQYRIMLKV